jgi:hypothetical protein
MTKGNEMHAWNKMQSIPPIDNVFYKW